MTARRITRISVSSEKITENLRFAVISDLHNRPVDDVRNELARCDGILVPGDLVDRHSSRYDLALCFLEEAPKLAPVFYSVGNHERKCSYSERWFDLVRKSKVTLLDNDSVCYKGIRIGGLSSSADHSGDRIFLERFEKETGFRLLLCHHPEMYQKDVRGRAVDLTLCGHAHGGQIRIGTVGLYSPGQGLFPRMTSGWYDNGKMYLSRGMTNGTIIPRINNPCEMILLELTKPEKKGTNDP